LITFKNPSNQSSSQISPTPSNLHQTDLSLLNKEKLAEIKQAIATLN
jgi:hypothetical protein